MKKLCLVFLFIPVILLCSCTENTSGYSNELTSSNWSADLDGGATARLTFNEDKCCFKIENADKRAELKGSFLADENSFVIFVPDCARNYVFEYTPKGNKLDLLYNGSTLTLEKEK